jgi:hypothetical protein
MSRTKRRQPAVRNIRRPRESRTIPMWDETDQDNGVYYKCWHCGFTCNDKRDSLGGEATRDGVTHSDYQKPNALGEHGLPLTNSRSVYRSGGLASVTPIDAGDGADLTYIIRSDSDGNSVEPVHTHQPTASSGCPFCGSMNWKGEY